MYFLDADRLAGKDGADRTQLVQEKTRTINRIQKVLEDANIKLASVATDIMGASGRAMIHRLIEGETNPRKLADLAQRQLRVKIPELQKALEGKLSDHHRFLLKMLWKELAQQEELLAELDAKIEEHPPFSRLRSCAWTPFLVSITAWPRSCWPK